MWGPTGTAADSAALVRRDLACIRQHTPAYVSVCQLTPAYATSRAYVSIRQRLLTCGARSPRPPRVFSTVPQNHCPSPSQYTFTLSPTFHTGLPAASHFSFSFPA